MDRIDVCDQIEARSSEAFDVMATMTMCSVVICHCHSILPECITQSAVGIIIGGVIGMSVFGAITMYTTILSNVEITP